MSSPWLVPDLSFGYNGGERGHCAIGSALVTAVGHGPLRVPNGGIFAVQAQRETFGAASGLQEFVQFRGYWIVAPAPELSRQAVAAGVRDDVLPMTNRIASKAMRLRLIHRQLTVGCDCAGLFGHKASKAAG